MKNLILLIAMIVLAQTVFTDNKKTRQPAANKIDCSFNKFVNKSNVCPNYNTKDLVK